MYHSITDPVQLKLVKKAKSYCANILNKLKMSLGNKYGVATTVHIIGSAKRNLITQNGDKPIDFDYNLEILDFGEYDDDEKLKRCVRLTLNDVIRRDMTTGIRGAGDVRDSTSVLTSRLMSFTDEPSFMFSFDVGIVYEDADGVWQRLIHDKTKETYEWKAHPDMDRVYKKYDIINSVKGGYEAVLDSYIRAKNRYLERADPNHPSFVCFAEAVNNVYNNFVQTGRILTAAQSGLCRLP
ncbi:MAG: hypothetical protein LUD72_03355 [Bacteroidales bacterium]|nr:hypothetical protein [Bacteroidales bacterium]